MKAATNFPSQEFGTPMPLDVPERVANREFSLIPTDAEPYISEADMIQYYRVRGAAVMALCTNNEGTGGVAVTRHQSGRHRSSTSTFNVVPYEGSSEPGTQPKFDFSRRVLLEEDGPFVPVGELLGMNREQAAIAGGSIWLSSYGGDLPNTRRWASVIVIDPGTRISPKTIWARERYSA